MADNIFEAMMDPSTYAHGPDEVVVHETHLSQVFVAGPLAFKLKKRLNLGYVDYRSLGSRRALCAEEIRLNLCLAPRVYRRVVAVVYRGGAWLLSDDLDADGVVDYAVEMSTVSEIDTAKARLDRYAVPAGTFAELGKLIARFHSEASVARDAHKSESEIRTWVDDLFEGIDASSAPLTPVPLVVTQRALDAFLVRHADLFASRSEAGMIRDVHGDLRLEHVVLGDPLQVLDRVEFDATLRTIDVTSDLAFLVMELELAGAETLATEFMSAYQAAGGDPGPTELLDFYASARAIVRVRVACDRYRQLDRLGPGARGTLDRAQQLLFLAQRLTWRWRLRAPIVLCGASGSGKSTLATVVQAWSGWPRFSSDIERKRMVGANYASHAEEHLYGPEWNQRVYEQLGRLAAQTLSEGQTGVIVDATCRHPADRKAFEAQLPDGCSPTYIECRAPADVLKERIARRARTGPSDAVPELVDDQLREFARSSFVGSRHVSVWTDCRPEETLLSLDELIGA